MAKKSQRHPARHEGDHPGCMWGLISMFDFRHGQSTQKLLSDRRRGPRHAVATGTATNKPVLLTNLEESCQGIIGGEESTIVAVDAGKPSVKKLMEEEMFCKKDFMKEMYSVEVEAKQSISEYGGSKRKNHKRTNRSRSRSCEIYIEDLDASESLEPEKPCLPNSEKQSTNIIEMDDIMEEFCHQIHGISCVKHDEHDEVHNQPNLQNPDLEEKLSEAIKLLSQRLINAKHVTGDGETHPSEELKDALRILSSDKELSLKLLQGLNLSEQENDGLKRFDEVIHGKQRKFFRRKAKSLEKNPSKESKASQASNRIVILKPGPIGVEKPENERSLGSSPESQILIRNKGPNEGFGSYFFLTEIKRRLKQAMGKEQQEISPDGVPKRFPNKHQARGDGDKRYKENVGRNSPSKDHFFIEKVARPPTGVRKGEKTDTLKEHEVGLEQETATYPKQRISNIYVEAKKHLSEMLTSETGDVDFSSGQAPKTLGRILSLPEYNFSPTGSPGRDWRESFVTAQMRFSNNNKFQKKENVSHHGRMTLNSETELCVPDDSTDNEAKAPSNPNSSAPNELAQDNEVEKILCSVGDGMTSEGDVDILKSAEIVVQEDSNTFDTLFEPINCSGTRDDQNGEMFEVCDETRYSDCSKHDLNEENQSPSSALTSPSTSSITKKDDNLESVVEVSERPSPVSVLEPLFTEEDVSPASTRFQPAELPIQPRRIQFEEHVPSTADMGTPLKAYIAEKESIFEYVKAVVQASEENWDEFYIMSSSSDPLLDPSIFDEVEFFPNQLCYDNKLLFDCINEVLMEVYGRYFGCPLGLSFAKPTVRPAPDMKNAIHEVWEGVYWYLLPLPLPHTLEQKVKKDMAKTGTWMDLRYDSEAMIIEIGDAIFKDLMEETMLSCVNGSSESGNPSIAAELKEQIGINL
ncbi:hypothetical protein GH714_043227 [Hevea brasiliensis]|uniref:DUF4378 domain-containing protein n=1 Tax=Hevea brasiliensis TaxID=3981 RepID=A0A6A6K348_HEVBR|nr:hypothetical protein GH714_043227 [Hevea brasiliensis]